MPALKPSQPAIPTVIPAGELRHLTPEEVKPSTNNPRHLFDPDQLLELKKNIGEHGVLVPITVYQAKGQSKFSILDGERRYRCVVELRKEGRGGKDGAELKLPANVVEPPSKIAGLLYMFSIHNFREAWELMPTALSLKVVMEELEEYDNKVLAKLTGLSDPQIERCKKLLAFPERFQELSLDPNPATRIPSNFWIEALPVIDLALETVPTVHQLGRDQATDKLVDKYRDGKIRSVIHLYRCAMTHIAQVNNSACSNVGGVSAPVQVKVGETDRDKLVEGLKASMDFCRQEFLGLTDAKLGDSVPGFGGRTTTRFSAALEVTNDLIDHYATLSVYLRINGLLPPTAQKKQ